MNKENSLIIDEDGRIGFIGRKIFAYLNLKKQNPFAYPDGKLKKGDLIVYVDFESINLNSVEKEEFKDNGFDVNKLDKQIIYIGIYNNLDIQPICKNIDNDYSKDQKQIDTYFDGNEISVSFHHLTSKMELRLNEQYITAFIGKASNAIFCFDNLGLKYFNYSQNGRINGLAALLRGESYLGYSKIKNYFDYKINAKEIFIESFYNILEKAKDRESIIGLQLNRDNFYIFTNKYHILDQEYYQYYIQQKHDFIDIMNSATNYYRELVWEENKASNTTLASSFRL
ncbi:MAG: hypothetical protein VB095_08985, partial [Anaerovorax sp.]|nr:hypothetical protein [Anaerovorax sp.]